MLLIVFDFGEKIGSTGKRTRWSGGANVKKGKKLSWLKCASGCNACGEKKRSEGKIEKGN